MNPAGLQQQKRKQANKQILENYQTQTDIITKYIRDSRDNIAEDLLLPKHPKEQCFSEFIIWQGKKKVYVCSLFSPFVFFSLLRHFYEILEEVISTKCLNLSVLHQKIH